MPLGCYGDGDAVFTDDDEKPALLRSLAVHGKGNDNVRIDVNSRLDRLQAATLIEKLAIFPQERHETACPHHPTNTGKGCTDGNAVDMSKLP